LTPPAKNHLHRRIRSNTPLQALTLANDEAFVNVHRRWGNGLSPRLRRAARLPNTRSAYVLPHPPLLNAKGALARQETETF
jgi:hypothetical protein